MYEVINEPVQYREISGEKAKYPFSVMEVGQSFIIPADKAPKWRSLQVIASRAGTALGCKFRVAKLPNGDIQIGRIS